MKGFSLVFLALLFKPVCLVAAPSTSTIAFIPTIPNSQTLKAVSSAISKVNGDVSLLPSTTLKLSDSIYSEKKILEYAANLSSDKTLALLVDGHATPGQKMVSGLLQIPLVTTRPRQEDEAISNYISLSASRRDVNHAIRDVITHYQWTTTLVIFDVRWRDQAARFVSLLPSHIEREPLEIILDQPEGRLFDDTKKKLREMNNKLVEVIILFCDAEFVTVVMEEVHNTRSRTAERAHHWILGDMIPSFSMITEPSQIVLAFTPHIASNTLSQGLMSDLSANMTEIKNHSYYLYDSVMTFSHALDKVVKGGQYLTETRVNNVERTKNGQNILNKMKKVIMDGTTGSVVLNSTGDRYGMALDIMNLRLHSFVKIGEWKASGLKIFGKFEQNRISTETVPLNKLNRKLKIILARDSPFMIVTKDPKTGEEKREGYSVDLVEALAKILYFKYQLVESPDGKYGIKKKDGTWNGIIGELINKKADLSLAPLTITSMRLNYLKFSKPFMQFSMDIIAQKPKTGEVDILAFMMPYSIPVWLMTLGCLAFMTTMMTIINYFSPFSHKNGEHDGDGSEFNVFNSFWFSLASMLCQGADNTPKSLSGRILVGSFWFCILIWVSTYTANLAAFFSFRDTSIAVNTIEDIIKKEYVLHIMRGTALAQTLKHSNYSTYQKLYQKIIADNSIVKSPSEGMAAVRADEKHLMMDEHPYAETEVQSKPCDLLSIKGFMGVKGYGFAMAKDFPYASNISVALLKLQETGVLEDLKRKWWNYRSQCLESSKAKTSERLGLANMAGLYMLIGAGCVLGIIAMLMEVFWSKKGEAIKKALCCNKNKKNKEKEPL